MSCYPDLKKKHKPIPKELHRWVAEIQGVIKASDSLGGLILDYGQPWVESMQSYYRQRLRDVLSHPPEIPEQEKTLAKKILGRLE